MDESLQRWCITSLAMSFDRASSSESREICADPVNSAEELVDAAAFRQMAQSRSIQAADFLADSDVGDDRADERVQALARTCPIDEHTPVESLGWIHEFLVSRRHLSAKHTGVRASDSRKTNGIFYTPAPVIDYIVNQTLCSRLEHVTPDQVERLRIVDPAVGCGAFLVRAFRFLTQWHLDWFIRHKPDRWTSDVEQTDRGWQLTFARRSSILRNNLFGVDLDAGAITVARRTLLLMQFESVVPNQTRGDGTQFASNLKQGHALIGPAFGERSSLNESETQLQFDWTDQFPQVANQGGFDIVVGNPPYRRERDFRRELDEIGSTSLGRYRSPRMDLWYYFLHRGIQLLREGGTLSFITNAYWIQGKGADKLIAALRDDVHLDELFLLKDLPVFQGVCGKHQILRLTKSPNRSGTVIKSLSGPAAVSMPVFNLESNSTTTFSKTHQQLFRNGRLDVRPPADQFLKRIGAFPRLIELGIVRQGIAENPSTINRRTIDRFRNEPHADDWIVGEGVFSLTAEEVAGLSLSHSEHELLRPYHGLCDLGRYWSAIVPNRRLIYSTRQTCPNIAERPALQQHLLRFRAILDARRETRTGRNHWWNLHWPRDERIWRADKLVALQLAARPSFVPRFEPTYVSFSANVFVPAAETGEDLRYLSSLLNSRVLWAWFEHHAKQRGVGLELNGHVLEQAPIRRIDFANVDDVRQHQELIGLVTLRMQLEQARHQGNSDGTDVANQISQVESRIDGLVAGLYGLQSSEIDLVNSIVDEQSSAR